MADLGTQTQEVTPTDEQHMVDCSQNPQERPELSYCTRVTAAKTQTLDRMPYNVPDGCSPDGCTPDENDFLPRYAASFHKLLKHDPATGLLTNTGEDNGVANYKLLLKGLKIGTPSSDFGTKALNDLKLENRTLPAPYRPRVLINPRSSKALNIKGPDIAALDVGKIIYGDSYMANLLSEISLGSAESAAEMIEVYAMALLRDLPLGSYGTPPPPFATDVQKVIDALNEFAGKFVWGYHYNPTTLSIERITAAAGNRPVTFGNLFRGPTPGDLAGDYLSVFLTFERPPLFPSGCAPHVADLIGASQFAGLLGEPLRVPQGAAKDFGITLQDYAGIQNAAIPQPYPAGHFSGLGPLLTGRNLGDYAHVDNVYEQYIRAADILVGHQYARTPVSPYANGSYENEGDGPTLGPSDAYGLVGGVRIVAERAAFTQKYLVARRARPEVMGALIHLAKGGDKKLEKSLSNLLSTPGKVDAFLERVRESNWYRAPGNPAYRTYLLPQMYPEGSPAHPSWPSGHATVAGACITVLKAIFDDKQAILDPNAPLSKKPEIYKASNGNVLTVGGELDKLASNVALARNFGGVHYRSDGEHGILLGEEIAIFYLQDHLREYREEFKDPHKPHFEFTKRNGMRICVTVDSVTEIAAAAAKSARIHPKSQL